MYFPGVHSECNCFPVFQASKNILLAVAMLSSVLIKILKLKYCVKRVRIRSFSGPYFLVFSPNAGKYGP